jgi:hypothetical protein
MEKINTMKVVISHYNWNSTNERTFNIFLEENNDFKHLTNEMKKHTKTTKKEMISDSTIDLLAVSPLLSTSGRQFTIDMYRYIIFEGSNVNKMEFNMGNSTYESIEILSFDSIQKATNYVFNDLEKKLKIKKDSFEKN